MVSHGVKYAFSPEKKKFDLWIAQGLRPLAFGSRIVLAHSLRGHSEEDEGLIFRQTRIGTDGVPFTIYKLRTLDVNREPLNKTAQHFRRYGLDELAQIHNIKRGEMGVSGRRPLPVEDHEAVLDYASSGLVDKWNRWVLPTRPGLFSTFSLRHHQQAFDVQRPQETIAPWADELLESDLKDVKEGSLGRDMRLAGQVLVAMTRGEL
ncbi:MAG TPA: sugar transferase [Candidatus Saccharimonadales bacterium]